VSDEVAGEIAHASGGGRPLPPATRAFFESRFGHGFSGVRVHDGPRAVRLSRALEARAFTLDRDVFFGASEYRPESAGGRRLLAHELTHVVQQRGPDGAHTDVVQRVRDTELRGWIRPAEARLVLAARERRDSGSNCTSDSTRRCWRDGPER
jgi:hypothetical protein